MPYVIIFPTVLLALAAIFVGVKQEVQKSEKDMNEYHFVVRASKVFLWIGIVAALFFCALDILMMVLPGDTASLWIFVGFSLFAIAGVCLIVYFIRRELRVEGTQIIFTPVIGKKKTFTFGSITKVKRTSPTGPEEINAYSGKITFLSGEEIKVYSGKQKLFSASTFDRGYHVLVSRLQKEKIPFEY